VLCVLHLIYFEGVLQALTNYAQGNIAAIEPVHGRGWSGLCLQVRLLSTGRLSLVHVYYSRTLLLVSVPQISLHPSLQALMPLLPSTVISFACAAYTWAASTKAKALTLPLVL